MISSIPRVWRRAIASSAARGASTDGDISKTLARSAQALRNASALATDSALADSPRSCFFVSGQSAGDSAAARATASTRVVSSAP